MPAQVAAIAERAAGQARRSPTAVRKAGLSWFREQPAAYSESALALLWQRAHTLPDGLLTEDGRRFRIVYPGRPNTRAGPDFRDSVISTEDGRLVTGDVELHLDAPGWRSHGHDGDPNYNSVILHVVLRAKGRVSSEQQSRITVPVASLAPAVGRLERAATAPVSNDVTWGGLPADAMEALLDLAGDRRFLVRSRGFARELAAGDADQTLYAGLFEALGYAANRRPFRRLAEVVPFSTVASLRGEPAGTRSLAVHVLLLNAAGLATHAEAGTSGASSAGMVKRLPQTSRLPASAWRLFRVRPSNHPARRVIGAARLADEFLDRGPVEHLAALVDPQKPSRLVDALSVPPLIGAGRARDMAVNVVLPITHALAGAGRDGAAAARSLETYRAFPSLGDNEITREMKRLLSARGLTISVTGARRHQGLTHLYNVMTRPELARSEWPAMMKAVGAG